MPLVRGLTLLDLIAQVPPGAQGLVPDSVSRFLDLLNIANLQSRVSGKFIIHQGTVQSAEEAGLNIGPNFPLEIPGLNSGVPFQFSWLRAEPGTANTDLEGEPSGWLLDLALDRVAVAIPFGKAATLVPTSAVAPAHLEAGSGTRVKLYARGVLRLQGGEGGFDIRLIADPDPLVPTSEIGAVIETGFTPPHLLLHDSGFGMTVDRVILDLTDVFTPEEIVARGHGADFKGMTIREATLYLPRNLPFVGDVNLGVRDLLVGWEPTPALQGEARVELGRPLESAEAIAFFQEIDNGVVALGGPTGAGLSLTVTVHNDTGPKARVFGQLATTGVEAIWILPGGDKRDANDSGWFEVSMDPGEVLRLIERRTDPDGKVSDGQERTFVFQRAPDPEKPEHAPKIRVRYHDNNLTLFWDDVAFLRGPGLRLDFVTFEAIDTGFFGPEYAAELQWLWQKDGSTQSGKGVSFDALDVGWSQGTHTILLTDNAGNVRRVRVESVQSGDLYVGKRAEARGVTLAGDGLAPLAAVENSWDLAAYHKQDDRVGARKAATLEGGTLTVPDGTLAEVTIGVGTPSEPDGEAPVTEDLIRHARIRMSYNDVDALEWRLIRKTGSNAYGPPPPTPYPAYTGAAEQVGSVEEQLDTSFAILDLMSWTNAFPPETRFVVIGRCCDLGTEERNRELANERAAKGRALLESVGIDGTRIRFEGEQGPTSAEPDSQYNASLLFASAPAFDPLADPELHGHVAEGWRIKLLYSQSTRDGWGDAQDQPERKDMRGVDIYAIVPAATPAPNPEPTDATTKNPALVRVLVPGEDATVFEPIDPANIPKPFRLEVLAKWDSPSIVERIDWVPTLVQVTFEWASSAVAVPGLPADEKIQPTRPNQPAAPASDPDLWRVIGRFTTDQRSGQTSYLLSLDSLGDKDGLFSIVKSGDGRADEIIAVTAALAPALLGGITTDDPAGAAVRVGALIGAAIAVATLEIDNQPVINDGQVIVEKVEAEVKTRAIDAIEGMKVRLGVDYVASFNITAEVAGAVGLRTIKPVKIRYKNVGVEYTHDESLSILERLKFVFEDAKFEVSDPGQWSITGALGKFLGITAIRIGSGSVWAEVDLDFSLDLGVVEISRTTIRIEIDPAVPSLDVSIRKIEASIRVPSAIDGTGELMVLPDGFGASMELEVIPAKIKAWGGFAIREPNMVHIEGGVRFATGIPLGQTGLGLFGFAGRFVANGKRDIDPANTDIIGRELEWHARSIPLKYAPQEGQFAVGFGVYIGTMPDAGFTFSALGMLTIGFPDLSVVLAIDATILSGEDKGASEQKPAPDAPGPATFTLLGIVAIDPTAIGIAIQGHYAIPNVLDVLVPAGAYFPLQGSGNAAYLRVGSDGAAGRPDRPVTVRIMPTILDLRAFAFLMVEEKSLHDLGGKTNLDFDGFSIGMGAGMSVQWGGGPVSLKASLTILVGLGTRPFVLAGGIYANGELRLVCVNISVTGEITALVTQSQAQLKGEFCGSVDFFFFSVSGCVDFNVGSDPVIPPPPAEPLIAGMTLSDKFSRVVGQGAGSLGGIGVANTAWPDAAPTLRFAQGVKVNLTSADSFKPTPANGWPGVDWSGTNRVRYLYELNAVELIKHPPAGPAQLIDASDWPSAWWLPAFRNAVPDTTSTPPSSHEGWDLALLHWDPAPWSRALGEGGEGLEADPADSLGNLCEEVPFPTDYCVFGRDGQRLDIGTARLTSPASGQTPYPPDFLVSITEGVPPNLLVPQLAALTNSMGLGFAAGGVSPLHVPFTPPGEATPLTHTWHMPRATKNGQTTLSLGLAGDLVPEVSEPKLLLSLCLEVPDRGGKRDECVDFSGLKPRQVIGRRIEIDSVKFEDRGGDMRTRDRFPVDGPDGVAELSFSQKGLAVTLPVAAEAVTLELGLVDDKAALVIALDSRGREIARAEATNQKPGSVRLELRGRGIRELAITASHGTASLNRLCYTITDDERDADRIKRLLAIFENRSARLPLVRGIREGNVEEWNGEVVGIDINGRHGCVFVSYQPKDSRGPWSRFLVSPFPAFAVGVVRVCGIRHSSLVAAEQDEQAREELQDAWNDAATGPASSRYQLLEPNMRYEVRVDYKVATWVGSDPTQNPPNADSFDFAATALPAGVSVDSPTQSMFFRTAAKGALADDKVLDFSDQHVFDPRGLARYLRGFAPNAEEPSHLRNDALLAYFEMEWVLELLDLYGFDLEIAVRRTDGPPIPPSGVPPVVFPPLTLTWKSLPYELRDLADQRMIDVALGSSCLEGAPVEGATAEVMAELEPRARYDLVVRARPAAGASTEIGLSHFRASRYRTVAELVDASGFGVTRSNSFYPLDLLVTAAPPADIRLGDDALLDAAISAMGLDPFAPAAGPRSVALWQEVAGSWRLVAVLVDSDEAMIRGPRLVDPVPNSPRMEVMRARVTNVPALEPSELVPVRSNQSATRILLAVPGGIAVPDDAVLELEVREPSGLILGRRSILSVPLVIAQERP